MSKSAPAYATYHWPFVGHDALGQQLCRALQHQRLPSAILFVGPSAVGKATAARWLAQADVCQAAQRPCGECTSCRQIALGQSTVVRALGTADEPRIGVDDIRQALAEYRTVAWNGSHRWLLVSDAERLTETASNALLKFLEELPANVHVVMTTPQPSALLPTIVSRLATYYWHTVSAEELARHFHLNPQVVARAAGRPGWVQKMLQSKQQADDHQRAQTIAQRLTGTDRSRPTINRLASDIHQQLQFEEMLWREALLAGYGVSSRRLWPDLEFKQLSPARSQAAVEQYLARYDYSDSIQPRLLYDDLHLV